MNLDARGSKVAPGNKIKEGVVLNWQMTNHSGDSSDQRDLVTFRLANQIYALPIEPIVRIVEMVTVTPIPQVSSAVEGVINVHGVAVPVVNLRRHFDLSPAPLGLRTPIILVQPGSQMFGLIVDEVLDVLSLSPGQVSRVADILPEGVGKAPVLQGVAHVQNDTVLLLDIAYLLSPAHMRKLAQALKALPGGWDEEASENEEVEASQVDQAESPPEVVVEEINDETEQTVVSVDESEQEVE
jgi:purine-binding chemotaxis protein CheW